MLLLHFTPLETIWAVRELESESIGIQSLLFENDSDMRLKGFDDSSSSDEDNIEMRERDSDTDHL